MDMRKINEEVDNFDLDSIDIANIEITELELQRIRNNANRSCKVSKKRKVNVAAAVVGTVIVGGTFTPVIAKNIPEVREIFYELGLFKEDFKDYTEYIGEKKTTEYGEATLENLVVTDSAVLVSMMYKSNMPINYDNTALRVSLDGTDGYTGSGGESKTKKIDDYTMVITEEIDLYRKQLIENKKLYITLELCSILPEGTIVPPMIPINLAPPINLGKFKIKSKFKSALENKEVINIVDGSIGNENIKTNQVLKTLDSNALGTRIYSEQKADFDWFKSEFNYDSILRVDGKDYKPTSMWGANGINDTLGGARFKDVNVDDIRAAKSIELIIGEKTFKIK